MTISAKYQIKDTHNTIVVRSTAMPGASDGEIAETIEPHSGKSLGDAYSISFQPELLREGTSIRDYDNPPITVAGVADSVPRIS